MPFFLVTALFFLWGVPSNLNDVLIRQFMKSFAISRFQAGLVQSAFYMGYFLLAIPAALLMRKMGYKFGIVVGLLLFATGTLSLLACRCCSGAMVSSSSRCSSSPAGFLFWRRPPILLSPSWARPRVPPAV